jgi:hypothetical protein
MVSNQFWQGHKVYIPYAPANIADRVSFRRIWTSIVLLPGRAEKVDPALRTAHKRLFVSPFYNTCCAMYRFTSKFRAVWYEVDIPRTTYRTF